MAGKQKLFIHGGPPKTATTSLQYGLVQNDALLRERGFLYPYAEDAPHCYHNQHAPLVATLYDMWAPWIPNAKFKTRKTAVSHFLQVAERHRDKAIVISSELIFAQGVTTPERVAHAVRLLDDFDITLVAYLRRQDEHLVSAYQQRLRNGRETKAFDLDAEIARWSGAVLDAVKCWGAAIGAQNVIVRPFVSGLMHPDGILPDFLDSIGCDPSGFAPVPRLNETTDIRTAATLLRLNQTVRRGGRKATSKQVAIHLAAADLDSRRTDLRKPRLSARQSARVEKAFREENRQLVGEDACKALFAPQKTDAPDLTFKVDEDEVNETLIHLVSHLADANARAQNDLRDARATKQANGSKIVRFGRKLRRLKRRLFGKAEGSRRQSKSQSHP